MSTDKTSLVVNNFIGRGEATVELLQALIKTVQESTATRFQFKCSIKELPDK